MFALLAADENVYVSTLKFSIRRAIPMNPKCHSSLVRFPLVGTRLRKYRLITIYVDYH